METVGLFEQRGKRIGELSSGQQQRVIIAKALVNDPKMLTLDEPATGIDQKAQDKFYALLRKINYEKKL